MTLSLLQRQQSQRESAPGADSPGLAPQTIVEQRADDQAEVCLGLAAAGRVENDGGRGGRVRAVGVGPQSCGEFTRVVLAPSQRRKLAHQKHELKQTPARM